MKLAVAVHDLSPSQLAFNLISKANALVAENPQHDIVVLYEAISRPCLTTNIAVMQIAEGWGFDGVAIATTFSTASKILSFPSLSRRLFYCWDLDWVRMKQKNFSGLNAVYSNPAIHLVARGEEHRQIIESVWQRRCDIVEDFDFERLMEIVYES